MVKRLAKCIREYKLPTILSPIFVALEVVMEVFIPLVCSDLINFLQGQADISMVITHSFTLFGIDLGISMSEVVMGYVFAYAGILIGMAALALVFGIISGRCCAKASTGFAKNLRKDLYYSIQDFSFENIDNFSTSSLVTRLTTDITNVQNAFMMIIRMAVRAPFMFAASLVMTFTKSWLVALIFIGSALLLGVLMIVISIQALPIFRRVFKKYDKMNLRVQEDVRGARVVKAFVREDHEIKKFNDASGDIKNDFVKAETILAINAPVMNFIIYGLLVLICAVAAIMIVETSETSALVAVAGNLQYGDISALVQYATMIFMSMMMLIMVLVMIVMSVESARRINEVLTTSSTLTSPENGVNEVKDGSIEFDNVGFSYSNDKEKLALKNVNIKIESGQTIGILGSTGSSKSTLVQLIPRLYDTTIGTIKVGGVDVKDYDLKMLRLSIAMVLQKNVLFSGTIKENIRWGKPNATDEEIVAACKLAQADEFISQFPDGYDTYIEQGGTNVSGGQRQRLCIARAIIANPKIIIFDDSTSAVDTKTDALIRQAMSKSLPNATKIIIAQRVASVEDADNILIMENGEINAFAPHDELIKTNEIYKQAYSIQNKEVSK